MDSCDFISFISDVPYLLISLLKEYPNLFLFVFTFLSILRIYKVINKLTEQEKNREANSKEKIKNRIHLFSKLVKYISENKKIFYLTYWSFFAILLFILYSKEISLLLNQNFEYLILFKSKDYRLAKAILGLIASSLALVLILRQKKWKDKTSVLSIIISFLSFIWSVILIYSISYDSYIIDYYMKALLQSSGLLFIFGISKDLNTLKSGLEGMKSNMIDSDLSTSDSDSENQTKSKKKKLNIIKKEKKVHLELAEKIRNYQNEPSPLKTNTTAAEVKENLGLDESGLDEIFRPYRSTEEVVNENRPQQRTKSGSLIISLAEAREQRRLENLEKKHPYWIKQNKSWPITRVRKDDMVGIKGTISRSRNSFSIFKNPEKMEMANIEHKWKELDKNYKLWPENYFKKDSLDEIWMRQQQDMIMDEPDTTSTPAGYLKLRRSIILEHISDKQEERLRAIEHEEKMKKIRDNSKLQARTIGKSVVDVDGNIDPRRNLARLRPSDLLMMEKEEDNYKSSGKKEDKYLKNINLFSFISYSMNSLDFNLSFKDICLFITNNIDYILFFSLLLSFYILWIRIDKFVNIWFQDKSLEQDQNKKRKLIKYIKISLSFFYLLLLLVFWPSDYIFFSLLNNNKIGYRIIKFCLIYAINVLTIYINIKTKGLYSWSTIFSYFNLLVTLVLTILFILSLCKHSSTPNYSIVNIFIIGNLVVSLINALYPGFSINNSVPFSISEIKLPNKSTIDELKSLLKLNFNKNTFEDSYNSLNKNIYKVNIKPIVGYGSDTEMSNPIPPKSPNEFNRVSVQSMVLTEEEISKLEERDKQGKRKAESDNRESLKRRRIESLSPIPDISSSSSPSPEPYEMIGGVLSDEELKFIRNNPEVITPLNPFVEPFIIASLKGPNLTKIDPSIHHLDDLIKKINRVSVDTKGQSIHPLDHANWVRLNNIRNGLIFERKIDDSLSNRLETIQILSEKDKDVNGFIIGPSGVCRVLFINDYNFRRKIDFILELAKSVTKNENPENIYLNRINIERNKWFRDFRRYYSGISKDQRKILMAIVRKMSDVNRIEMENDIKNYNLLLEQENTHIRWKEDQKYNNEQFMDKAVALDTLLSIDLKISKNLNRYLRDFVTFNGVQTLEIKKLMGMIINQRLCTNDANLYLRNWSSSINTYKSIEEHSFGLKFEKINSSGYRYSLWQKRYLLAQEILSLENYHRLLVYSHYNSLSSRYEPMKQDLDIINYIDRNKPSVNDDIIKIDNNLLTLRREEHEKNDYYRANKEDIKNKNNNMNFMKNFIPLTKNFYIEKNN
jgi:hypothetical protein